MKLPHLLRRLWWWFLAYNRLSDWHICEMSKDKGLADDYHDYKDTKEKFPDHFATLECERCRKKFTL